jgi:hypothetical protein
MKGKIQSSISKLSQKPVRQKVDPDEWDGADVWNMDL